MAKKRDLVQEVLAKRSRGWAYPTVPPTRLLALPWDFERHTELDGEILKYFPIAAVACVEGFFRAAIKELVDKGSPYFENMADFQQVKDFRFDLPTLSAVQGKLLSVGDLLSHMVSISSLGHIEAAMSAVLGEPFLPRVEAAVDRFEELRTGKPGGPTLKDPAAVYAQLGEMFAARHIYAHEIAMEQEAPARAAVKAMLTATEALIGASATVIQDVLHPGAPLTQADMNQAAATDYDSAQRELKSLLERAVETAKRYSPEAEKQLVASQQAWEQYCDGQAQLVAAQVEGGSMWPSLYYSEMETLTRRRIDEMTRAMQPLNPHEP